MKLNHKFVVPAAFDVAWDAFNDLAGLVPCLPGASLLSAEGDSFSGEVKVKLGPISMTYGGTGTFIERDKASGRMVVEAKGKDKRGNGTAGATVTAQMTPEGTGTAVEVATDLSVTGKPAQFGRAVIQDVSDKLLGQFVDCISAKLSPAMGADGAAAATTTQAATTQAAEPITPPAPDAPASSGSGEAPGPPSAPAPTAAPATQAQAAQSSLQTPAPSPAPSPVQSPPSASLPPAAEAKPAELNLLSTVMPVLVRRYALPVIVVLVIIAGIWVWVATR